MRLNKYWPFAFIFFFVNAVGLPMGLTYTALLGPLFYAWVLLKRQQEIFLPFVTVMIPFIIGQIIFSGVDLPSYSFSFLNIVMIYFFLQAVYTFFILGADYQIIFRRILLINGVLCLLAVVFYFTPFHEWFWIEQDVTKGLKDVNRLKMFTYEASYYAQLFVPIFLFFLFQYWLGLNKLNNVLLVFLITIPLVLSFSVGVLACLLFALIVCLLVHFHSLVPKRRVINSIITVTAFIIVTGFIVILFFRDNALLHRLGNIISGEDSSGRGRTEDAFYLALKILQEKNEIWGIGPGQLKWVGSDLIRAYYLYYDKTPVAIPNVTAETLMVFGWAGIGLKFLLEFVLFVTTKVWKNYFRLSLFLFMFAYQFTGSFLTNVVEYVIWIMAFTPVFKEFEARRNIYSRIIFEPQRLQNTEGTK